MKKYISSILAIVFVLSCITPVSFAAEDELENVALNKPAYATTQYSTAMSPDKVTDGNFSSSFATNAKPGESDFMYPKDAQGNQWVTIDLGGLCQISRMIAYSRNGEYGKNERKGWLYQVATTADFSDVVTIGEKTLPGSPAEGYEVSLKKPVIARYVRVASPVFFVVAEIEVYGALVQEKELGNYNDIENKGTIYDAAQIVSALGVIEGITYEDFGVANLMTRAEAAEFAARLQGSGELDYADTGYQDVGYEYDKSGYISWCENMGVISKGDLFRPEDFITGTEFVTMLLRLNGWYYLAQAQKSPYPENVLYVAQRTKLTKGADVQLNGYLNRSQALILVYNMLTSEMFIPDAVVKYGAVYSNGDTYLDYIFGLSFNEGIVEQAEGSNLIEPVEYGSSMVTIDGIKYKDDSGNASAYLGERVCFLSNKDDSVVHMWRNTDNGTLQTIMCTDVIKSDAGSITYYDENADKNKRVSLESPIYFIKNGVASGDFRLSNLKRVNGKLTLIDNDRNGKVDVIKLYEPKVIVVDYIGIDGERLSIGAQNGDSLDVPSFEKLIITKNGFAISYEEILPGSLVYAYVSDNKKYVELVVSTKQVSGTIEEFGEDDVTIDGETYKFSDYYTVNEAIIDDIRVGAELSFLLDENGLIVWSINDSIVTSTEMLAVILDVYFSSRTAEIQLFNENNEMLFFHCATKVKVDGERKSISEIVSLGADYFVGKAVIYKLNSNGLVTYLNTENYNNSYEKEDVMQLQNKWTLPEKSGRASNGFYSGESMILPVYNDFSVFTIPKDSVTGEILSDEDFAGRFSCDKINKLFPKKSESTGDFTFYGKDDDETPSFAVRYISVNASGDEVNTVRDYKSTSTFVVDHLWVQFTEDGDETYKICGFDAMTGAETNLIVAPSIKKVVDTYEIYLTKRTGGTLTGIVFDTWNYIDALNSSELSTYLDLVGNLKRGDVLRYEHDGSFVTALERIYSVSDTSLSNYIGNVVTTGDSYTKVYRAGYRAFSGVIESTDNSIVKLDVGAEILEGFNYKTSSIKRVIILENNELKCCETSFLPMYAAEDDTAFVVSVGGDISSMIVYK